MRSARPRGFDSEGQYDAAEVYDNPEGGAVFRVDLYGGEGAHEGVLTHQISADRVLAGGGLPDEAIEVKAMKRGGLEAVFHEVDACVRHDDGDTVVWLAP